MIRKDLKMRRGKEIAQGSHASMMFLSDAVVRGKTLSKVAEEWLEGSFTKVVVTVQSERELLDLAVDADELGVLSYLCIDAGRTEFHGESTPTALALGPDYVDRIDKLTAALPLY